MRFACFAIVFSALSGCGAAYISSDVREAGAGAPVTVVALTVASVETANGQNRYQPRELPAYFSETAGYGSGLRGAGALPDSPLGPEAQPAAIALTVPPATPQQPYRIGVSDVLSLATGTSVTTLDGLNGLADRRQGYTVQDDGAITLPEVGRIQVGGKTIAEAEAEIFKQLVDRQINPSFSLEVSQFASQRVSIGGAVRTPVVVPLSLTPLRLNEALTQAGGLSLTDSEFGVIRLYRDGTLYQIPLQDYLAREDLQRITLADADSVFVDSSYELGRAQAYFEQQIQLNDLQSRNRAQALTELQTEVALRRGELAEQRDNYRAQLDLDSVDRDYVYILGEVGSPTRFPLPFGQDASLADALLVAGGISPATGDPSQIYVLRDGGNGGVNAWHLDASNAVNFVLATRFDLRPDDVIFVAEQPITRWNRVVQQIVPSLINSGVAAATR